MPTCVYTDVKIPPTRFDALKIRPRKDFMQRRSVYFQDTVLPINHGCLPSKRTIELAEPKMERDEFIARMDRDSAITKVSKAARTRKSVSNRLIHLALPKTICLRYQFFPKPTSISEAALNAKASEHTRLLATPKGRQFTPSTQCFDPVPFDKPISGVSANALKAGCSRRVEFLATPKPLDEKNLMLPLPKPIDKATLRAQLSERTRALAEPRWIIHKEIIDPFAVLPRALGAITTDRTTELAKPRRIKGIPQKSMEQLPLVES